MPVDPKSEGTFLFADLAGFSALTEAHGDEEAIEIAADFEAQVRELTTEHGGEVVKTIGDEVMIRVDDPARAVKLGLGIVEALATPGSPPVRVGMHSGSAIGRDGDWFGGTVNLAARVVGVARPGEVFLTDETRRRIADAHDSFDLEPQGSRHVKHIPEPVAVYRAIDPGGAGHHLEIDPVCRMAVDPETAAGRRRRRGLTYYFCSGDCLEAFAAEPRRYIATSRGARAARRGFLINLGVFLTVGAIHLGIWAFGSDHDAGSPLMLLLYVGWAIALGLHYRAVREAL